MCLTGVCILSLALFFAFFLSLLGGIARGSISRRGDGPAWLLLLLGTVGAWLVGCRAHGIENCVSVILYISHTSSQNLPNAFTHLYPPNRRARQARMRASMGIEYYIDAVPYHTIPYHNVTYHPIKEAEAKKRRAQSFCCEVAFFLACRETFIPSLEKVRRGTKKGRDRKDEH